MKILYNLHMKIKSAAIAFICLLVLLAAAPSHAAWIDPDFKFQTTETEHFIIHYHQGLESVADKAVKISEEVHCELIASLKWIPQEKTHLVLFDTSDLANGFTTVIPYNAVYVYTVPPMPDMTIGQYHDWLRLVITHEYAHVLTMDAARGYSKVMRRIFGKPLPSNDPLSVIMFFASVPPNVLLPHWWLEGSATWAETEYNPIGRGKSTYYEMIFRTAVAENNLLSIDKINGDIPYWPSGNAPYIYGLALNRHIARHYGADAIGQLSLAHAGRAPYFIAGAAQTVTEKTYGLLYRDMIDELEQEQAAKIKTIRSTGLTKFKELGIKGERLTNPRFSPDSSMLAVNRRDPHDHESIVIIDVKGNEIKSIIRRLPSDHTITWMPDNKTVCYTQADLHRGYNLYQDLYCLDIIDDVETRLTNGQRVKDPDASPKGPAIAVVKVEDTAQSLAIIEAESPDVKIIKRYENMRVSNPRWSPDGNKIIYTVRDDKAVTSLVIFDKQSGSFNVLIEAESDIISPAWGPDGKYVIYTSDASGVFNLHALRVADKKTYRITNLIGGAFQPDIDKSGNRLLFSYYHSRGFSIVEMPFNPQSWGIDTGRLIKTDWPSSAGTAKQKAACEQAPPAPKTEPEGYSALNSALPRFWLPTLRSDNDGAALGAFTAGQDVLGYHTYLAEADMGENRGYYYFIYQYDRHYPTLRISAYEKPVMYADYQDETDMFEKEQGYTASMRMPLNRLEKYAALLIGYQGRKQTWLEGSRSFEGRRNNAFIGLEFNNALKYPYSISREEGRILSALYRHYSPETGSDVNSREYHARYDEYIGVGDHDVVYTKLKAALSEGERIPQAAFRMGGSPADNDEFSVRGYKAGYKSGQYITTATLEYRTPLVYIMKGTGSKPFYFDRVHLSAFADAGICWDEKSEFKGDNVDLGVGVEGRMDMKIGYNFRITPAIGIAKGVSGGGEYQAYIIIYSEL